MNGYFFFDTRKTLKLSLVTIPIGYPDSKIDWQAFFLRKSILGKGFSQGPKQEISGVTVKRDSPVNQSYLSPVHINTLPPHPSGGWIVE
jgi:hypothetical protein